MTCHTSYLQKSIYTALSNTQQMLHCFFFPHEQYSTACLLWYFAILNLDYPIPKIFFFQYLISKLLQFISCSFMAQIFNIIYCKLVKYVYKRQFSSRSTFRNMTVVQTSDIGKKHVFCIFWTTRDISFFLSLLSLFEKKFLIWSMRKPRVINIILSSSVKFTVNQVLWMWAYALAPVLRVLYSQLHFRFEFEQLSLSITLKCLLFWLRCHNFHHEYCYLRGLKCLTEFQPLFLYAFFNRNPLPNCWQIFTIFFFFLHNY